MLRLLITVLQWPYVQTQVHLTKILSSIRDYKTHNYLPVTVVAARKALPALNPGSIPELSAQP